MLSTNGIRAVIFDLDGTLRYNHPSSEQTFFEAAVSLGLKGSAEDRQAATRWAHEYWAQSAVLLTDIEEFGHLEEKFWINYYRRCLVAIACPEEMAEQLGPTVHRYMVQHHQPEDRVFPGALETLDILQKAGFRLAVVSNRTHSFAEQIQSLGMSGFFDCLVAAGDLEIWKPDPLIFEPALNALGVEPGEAIYVGDNYYADVIGAQRAGLRPVLLDPEGVFPEANCEVIGGIEELLNLLEV